MHNEILSRHRPPSTWRWMPLTSQGSTSPRRFPNDEIPLATGVTLANIKHLAMHMRNSDSSNNIKIQLAVGEQWCSTTSSLSLSFSFSHPTEPVPFLYASTLSPTTPPVMIPPPLLLSHRRLPRLSYGAGSMHRCCRASRGGH